MVSTNAILWFKTQFQTPIAAAVAGTPFDLDMVTAIACQETGHIWGKLHKEAMSVARILELCVGDTLDSSGGRSAFPRTKADLVAKPSGAAMFKIARDALVDMAKHIPGFAGAAGNPNKFCHGYGIFQHDLQFFLVDPAYFLNRDYIKFPNSLAKCLHELQSARTRAGLAGKTRLTDFEFACVAIAYNTGRFRPARGLKQGFFDGTKFYGEHIAAFLAQSRAIAPAAAVSVIPKPPAGQAEIAPPTTIPTSGKFFRVETKIDMLRVRSTPKILPNNLVGRLPDGHVVRGLDGGVVNGFREIETSLAGAHIRGFASDSFLKPVAGAVTVPVAAPPPAGAAGPFPEAVMPRKAGSVTTRAAPAGAHSLNETGMPGRKGTAPAALRAELAAIIDYLAVDKATHLRYKPSDGSTFCNIYAHDYCALAGVYLPRVWWTAKALVAMTKGQTVAPHLADTIVEMRANDLFRWLRDFGSGFGWRQTGTLTKLQDEVNGGAIGLIVARRKLDGRAGHIVAVVPETAKEHALRGAANLVLRPLQSQAGTVNFRYGTGRLSWWTGAEFAESAFWLHN